MTYPGAVTHGAWVRGEFWRPPPDTLDVFMRRAEKRIIKALDGWLGTPDGRPIIYSGWRGQPRRFRWIDMVWVEGWLRFASLHLRKPSYARRKRERFEWIFGLMNRQHVRQHPRFWFIACPLPAPFDPGGILVIPDCVLPQHWQTIRMGQRSYWLWRYWERWDCLRTWPNVPDDLVRE